MELGGENVAPPDAGDEFCATVVGRRSDNPRIVGHGIVRVDEVDRSSVRDAVEVRSVTLDMELVPAHVGNLAAVERCRVEAYHLALENVEPTHAAELYALREEDLHTYTDAEEGRALFNDAVDGVHQAALGQAVHTSAKRAYPGQDHPSGGLDAPGITRYLCHIPHLLEAFLHAAQVAHAVIDDGNHKRVVLFRCCCQESS